MNINLILTGTEIRLLEIARAAGQTSLADLSFDLGLSRVHTQTLARSLEKRGYLAIAAKRWTTDPLKIAFKTFTPGSSPERNIDDSDMEGSPTMQLTETENRLLELVRDNGGIKLPQLSDDLCQSRKYTGRLVMNLAERGYLSLAGKAYKTAPLSISFNTMTPTVTRTDFDKLLFSTAWV